MIPKQQEIIQELGTQPTIDAECEIEERVAFLTQTLGETGARGYVLGISGGQDSLLAGVLAQRAVQRVRADGGEARFTALLLPYGEQADRKDAELACDFIQPDTVLDFPITETVNAFADSFERATNRALTDFDKGNAKARARMVAQYAVAGANNLLVLGTDHAAEAITGFFTKYGDGGADILPLSGLNKRQGRQLLQQLGAPAIFMAKAPTADLLDTNPGQADEAELGTSYTDIDDYLEGREVPDEVAEFLEDRFEKTQHKRTMPKAFETTYDR